MFQLCLWIVDCFIVICTYIISFVRFYCDSYVYYLHLFCIIFGYTEYHNRVNLRVILGLGVLVLRTSGGCLGHALPTVRTCLRAGLNPDDEWAEPVGVCGLPPTGAGNGSAHSRVTPTGRGST